MLRVLSALLLAAAAWPHEPPEPTQLQAPAAAKKHRRHGRERPPSQPAAPTAPEAGRPLRTPGSGIPSPEGSVTLPRGNARPPAVQASTAAAADRALPLGPGDPEPPPEEWLVPVSTAVRALSLPPAPAGGGWAATPSSLLLYSSSGKTLHELGLDYVASEDMEGSFVTRRVMRGGVSKDGRFAWHWEKVTTLKRERTDTVLASTRAFAYLGTNGYRLWSDDDADAPAREDPARISDSGETVLVRELRGKEWSVAAVDFTGNRLMELGAGTRIESWSLAPTGRFAHFCWSGFEGPLVCSFLNIEARTKKDVPAADLPPGGLRVLDDGSVLAGGRLAFRLR
ncbi:MAG: hypothetical protein HY922_09930 [Elusimicrobia bacterium]|nr:hypothetical protein [Elusimicrobiota bacterium]